MIGEPVTRRRATDSEQEDYRSQRHILDPVVLRPLNGHTRWIVAAVGAAILSLAGWGILNDRAQIDRRLLQAETERSEFRQTMLENRLAIMQNQTESKAFREEVLRRLDVIEKNVRYR